VFYKCDPAFFIQIRTVPVSMSVKASIMDAPACVLIKPGRDGEKLKFCPILRPGGHNKMKTASDKFCRRARPWCRQAEIRPCGYWRFWAKKMKSFETFGPVFR
jgi:hypothetical protein